MNRIEVGPDRRYAFTPPSDEDPVARLWTIKRLPFESDQNKDQKAMVTTLRPAIRSIPWSSGEVLSGVFASDDMRGRQPDAENIVYYNLHFVTGGSPFTEAPPTIWFERSFAAAPRCAAELMDEARYYHAWAALDPAAGFGCWKRIAQKPLAEWSNVPCRVVDGDSAGRHVWLAMCENMTGIAARPALSAKSKEYGIEVSARVPRAESRVIAAGAIKGCVDGSIASFQSFPPDDHSRARDLILKLSRWKGWQRSVNMDELFGHVTREDETVLFPGGPFNANGLDPCDDRCVAGAMTVVVDPEVSKPQLSGELFAVERIPPEEQQLHIS